MRIGIEGQRLFREKKGGMDVVAWELVQHLAEVDKRHQYVVFAKPGVGREALRTGDNVEIVEVPGGNYLLWEQWHLPRMARRYRLDLLHCTSNTVPLWGDTPLVLTLHDIIFLEEMTAADTATRYQQLGRIYRRWNVPRGVKKARKIITVSKQERDRILRQFPALPPDRVEVVHNGVAAAEFRPVEDASYVETVRQKYQLADAFFLFLGNQDPKKNMPRVLEAYGAYRDAGGTAGFVMTAIAAEILESLLSQINRPDLKPHIRLPGYVSRQELVILYQLATAYLYPSLREGFGLPILEAFGSGTPVITSNTSSMPEVAGDAALLVDPFSVESITAAMRQIDRDDALRASLVERGTERLRHFSWRKMGESVVKIYDSVLKA